MIAAIYARKSTEQTGADADAKSIARQIENARAFAVAKGWTVAEAHVYADDAVSGAETRKLVARQRLLEIIGSGRLPFQVLIMRDSSRLSREDGDEAFGELKQIAKAGIEIRFYADATRFEYGNFAANISGFVRAEMNAEFRRQISRWTREAMVRKATAGHVTGGTTFGYDNVRVAGHVERRINEREAAVVQRIFDLCASGTGYTRIAKQLNAERVISPRAQQRRPTGWSPSTVYEVLHRPLYRGEVVWNKTKKRNAEGRTAVTTRPESEWMRRPAPELRIVTEEAWQAAHARLGGIRARLAAGNGVPRRRRDIDSKYFLSGFARCARCGGTLSVLSRQSGKKRIYVYGCLAHAKRGDTICDNALVLPVERVDDAVRAKLTMDVLRPAVVRALVAAVFDALQPRSIDTNVNALKRDLRTLDDKIAHLTAAVERGAALAPLVTKLQERQSEREAVMSSIAATEAITRLQVDRRTVEQKVLKQVEKWRELFASNGRQALREVLEGPMRFTRVGEQYRFEGDDTTGKLIAGLVCGDSTLLSVPNGIREKVESRFSGIAA